MHCEVINIDGLINIDNLINIHQEGAERILQNRSHHSGQSSEAQSLKDPSSPVSNNGGGPCSGLGFKPAQIVRLADKLHRANLNIKI